jgi:hypothetical protein
MQYIIMWTSSIEEQGLKNSNVVQLSSQVLFWSWLMKTVENPVVICNDIIVKLLTNKIKLHSHENWTKTIAIIIYTPKKDIEAYEQYFHLVFCHLNPLSL